VKTSGKFIVHDLPVKLAGVKVAPVSVDNDDDDSAIPAELRNWLVRLRLLEGVPFANLVADSELLPSESIRWFYIDRRWTDALVQGALSVGTVNTDDRTQLTANYPAIREELDAEERNLRRARGTNRWKGGAGPISGFLLRSQAVSGWPALHVRAFNVDPANGDDARYHEDDPRRMRLLRLERLAPAVLLCMFDGIPSLVHMEEPRQGVQFGFDAKLEDGQIEATLRPRNRSTFEYLGGSPIEVPFRSGGAAGVIDIQQLERRLAALPETGAADSLESSEYALQLVRFPYRQVFGEVTEPELSMVFRPTVSYERVAKLFKEVL
jgi:hypothetical protein